MLFNSSEFAVFFPVVTLLYFATPHRLRWLTLLVASGVFYAAFIPSYLAILAGMILIDYAAGLMIERAAGRARLAMLVASLAANLGVLAVFKYLPVLTLAVPLGLSFHTFQAMAYTIEVYRGRWRAERHLGIYALYVMFYPQLVAGPIERPARLLPQFRTHHRFDPGRAALGLQLMAWGLFKKVVIADRLAQTVNAAYARPQAVNGPAMIVATVFYAWQIYCDFSGYSDIAIGAAQVMGFTLTPNFRRPYLARSTREFWTRWHMSLSTWFRDYLYIPLGGSRGGPARWAMALMVTFLLSGLWHGANRTFVIWGGLHGLFLVGGRLTADARASIRRSVGLVRWPRIEASLQRTMTFALISLGWIFFRAQSVGDAMHVIGHLFSTSGLALSELGVTGGQFALACAGIASLVVIETVDPAGDPRAWLEKRPAWARWTCYYAIILLTISVGVFNRSQFIYFQF